MTDTPDMKKLTAPRSSICSGWFPSRPDWCQAPPGMWGRFGMPMLKLLRSTVGWCGVSHPRVSDLGRVPCSLPSSVVKHRLWSGNQQSIIRYQSREWSEQQLGIERFKLNCDE
ncbi:predicted protein [Histoplasma capsulatum G186AR]|uniref:Uncharacterized protein n=1 Tax=Ajellomyces capsulatus (strain G186AR / H82 / ATCC MYA-2454 / RMSCC 2432) TaxID=447093 RepID=C0NNQ2_AJECG|nr:uncharacterized protein HCBG_04782 [Histoplasma capsulatum G186AR]EEH06562.1 predicted protein [Histoplasma capsulatum G186AR]